MALRASILAFALALSVASTAAAATSPAYTVDLTLAYEPPPDPDFAGSQLTGQVQFSCQVVSTFNAPACPPGPPVDIGDVAVGDSLTIHFIPPGPCFSAGACNLFFSLDGAAAGFLARAYPPGPPTDDPNFLPAVQFGGFDANGLPAVQSGPIYAFDAPVQVGTWDAVFTPAGAPESATWALLLMGFVVSGVALRRQGGMAVT